MKVPSGMTLEDLCAAIRRAVDARFPPGPSGPWPYCEGTTEDAVIVDLGNGNLVSLDWSISDAGEVTLGAEAKPVVEKTTYEPVTASVTIERSLGGKKYRVRVASMGLTKNVDEGLPVYFDDAPEQVAQFSRLFAGAKLYGFKFSDGTFDHLPDHAVERKWLQGRNEFGYLADPVVEGAEVFATAALHDDVPKEILAAIEAAADPTKGPQLKPIGLSIDAACTKSKAVKAGKLVALYTNFRNPSTHPASIDIVTSPAANGEWLRRVAASVHDRKEKSSMSQEQALATVHTEKVKDLESHVTAANATAAAALADAKEARRISEESQKATAIAKANASAETLVRASRLPAKAQDAIIASCAREFDRDDAIRAKASEHAQKLIDEQRAILSELDARPRGGRVGVEVGAGPQDKFALGLERLFLGSAPERVQKRYADFAGHKGRVLAAREQEAGIGSNDRVYSYRRLVREALGVEIEDLWGHGPEGRRVRASVTLGQWGDVFENVLNKVGLSYQEDPDFGDWRKIVNIRNFTGSTLKQERMVVGGYANLPAVSENTAYVAATTPGDQGHGYTVLKYGYTESWSREAQINDNFGELAEIVRRMALAADRTKYEYFFDLLTIAGAPTMDYDTVNLYHANHGGNLATTALSNTQLKVRRLNMRKQTDFANSKRLALSPKYLIVPEDLAETATDCVKPISEYPPGGTTDNSFIRRWGLEVIVVRHWTNTKDWFLEADPRASSIPVYEAGFLNGREMAEIFVQDDPRMGSVFDRDSVTVKIAQDYFGGTPLRHEAFDANDVA